MHSSSTSPSFGETQDAMLSSDPFLNHSLLSFYINLAFLIRSTSAEGQNAPIWKAMPINAVEGFIRQIIGWRNICVVSTGTSCRTMRTAPSDATHRSILLDRHLR